METVQYFMHMVVSVYYRVNRWLVVTWTVIMRNLGLFVWLVLLAYALIVAIALEMSR